MPRFLVRDFGTCLNFSGGTNSVNCGVHSNITTIASAISVSSWIKLKSTGSRMDFLGQWSTPLGYHFNMSYFQGGVGFSAWISTTGSNFFVAEGTTVPQKGIWYHVVHVYDGSNIFIYLNGIQDGIAAQTGSMYSSSTDNFYIGKDGDGNNVNALMDDVRLYNAALTATQVSNLYYGIEPPTTNLVSRWNFDEGSGTTANDSVGSNNGTITGATYSTDVFMKPRTVAS